MVVELGYNPTSVRIQEVTGSLVGLVRCIGSAPSWKPGVLCLGEEAPGGGAVSLHGPRRPRAGFSPIS